MCHPNVLISSGTSEPQQDGPCKPFPRQYKTDSSILGVTMPADGKFSIEYNGRRISFFLKPTSESSSELFSGNKKIGAFRKLNDGTWKVKFGACGEMWTGTGDASELLEAIGRFIVASEERRKLPPVLNDDSFKGHWAQSIELLGLEMRYRGLDRDLAIEQAKREHLRLVNVLDDEINKVSPRFTRL